MMKRIVWSLMLTAVFLTAPTRLSAETIDVQYLVLTQQDGSTAKFALTDYPVLTFNEANELVVTCQQEVLTVDIQSLTSYDIITEQVEKETTAIATIQANDGTIPSRPTIAFGEATFSNLKAGQRITVYTIDGRVVNTVTVTKDGTASVQLNSLPKGVYILRSPQGSVKVKK